jgi:hypothetical protein
VVMLYSTTSPPLLPAAMSATFQSYKFISYEFISFFKSF